MNAHVEYTADAHEESLRRCALALHAISAEDRAWLLQKLPSANTAELERLLEELKVLGIVADPAAARSALKPRRRAKPAPAEHAQPDAGAHEPANALARAHPAELARLLRHEPAGLIAQLIETREAKWGAALLAVLDAPKRRRVQDIVVATQAAAEPGAPRLAQAVGEEMAKRLASGIGGAPARRPSSLWGPWQSGWARVTAFLS